MRKYSIILGFVSFIQLVAVNALAQYQPVQPGLTQQQINQAVTLPLQILAPILGNAGAVESTALNGVLDKSSGQLNLAWPQETISYSQLDTIIKQVPGLNNLQIQFPNQTGWTLSPEQLMQWHNEYMKQTGGLGFGVGGSTIPELVFSSIMNHPDQAKALAMIPISQLKQGMDSALEPVLRDLRYKQLALWEWMPDWLKDAWLWLYNAFMPYYYGFVDWVASFF